MLIKAVLLLGCRLFWVVGLIRLMGLMGLMGLLWLMRLMRVMCHMCLLVLLASLNINLKIEQYYLVIYFVNLVCVLFGVVSFLGIVDY